MIRIGALLALVLTLLLGCVPREAAAEEMSLMAFAVGKADCLLLRCGGNAYLIDTGRGGTWEETEEKLSALGVERLDAVLITHMDSDHVGGLKKLLKSGIGVDHIYISPWYLDEDGEDEKNPGVKAAEKNGRKAETLKAGTELPLGTGTLKVIGPVQAAKDKEDNNSLVLYAQAAGGSIPLAGDMEFPEETTLLRAGVIPEADVLKVGNHGDDDATSEALLSAVRPKVAVISTSTAEKASTPADRVIEALEACDAEILQTQEAETGILVTIRDGEITAERVN